MLRKKMPRGIENFADLRRGNYYYVDKTMLIKELLDDGAYVSLFTRPRRFGKSLTISMLKHFFEIGTDRELFDGLAIQREEGLCEKHMGQYPVISISLKTVEARDYDSAYSRMWSVIKEEADRFSFLADSERLDAVDKDDFLKLRTEKGKLDGSLRLLSRLLYKHYNRKVIILIDEYDVPLDKASGNKQFYAEMVDLIRSMFNAAMKTNDFLSFAVVTGCLRISKESVFTGINNFSVNGIENVAYDEYFGFTDGEVGQMLKEYNLTDHYPVVKEWYDGYRMGQVNVYCPWDVVSYVRSLLYKRDTPPENFWANTSGNDMITRFADLADADTRGQIERLMEGKSVWKKLEMDLTYEDLYDRIDHIWSVLFTTGYLTQCGMDDNGYYELVIPNREITCIFSRKIDEWFTQKVLEDEDGLREFFDALDAEDAERLEACLTEYMMDSISYLDSGKTEDKENFYHGLLLGMMNSRKNWEVKSNREGGKGRPDIVAFDRKRRYAIIIEIKCTKKESLLEKKAKEALDQIKKEEYDEYFGRQRTEKIVHYGIAFCEKDCRLLKEG